MTMTQFLFTLLAIAVAMGGVLTIAGYLILLERKVAAWVQDRIGPNRCGFDLGQPELRKLFGGFRFFGLGQPLADGLKFFLKEQIVPGHVNKVLYFLAPSIAVLTTMAAFAVVPFGPTVVGTAPGDTFRFIISPGVDIGIVYIFAVTSLTVYAVILGGWASNSKYSFLGGIRSSAQVISYEIPLGMSILGVVLLTGSLNLEQIQEAQARSGVLGWYLWVQPLAFLMFMIAAMAESNRMPFDLPECEQELVGGYHTEYGGMKFMMFFLGEYTHVITTSYLMSVLFLGGYQFPWIAEWVPPGQETLWGVVVKALVLLFKVMCCVFLIMMIRWTIPRFRFDQLMGLAWKVLVPLCLLNLFCVMCVKEFEPANHLFGPDSPAGDYPPLVRWVLLPLSIGLFLLPALLAESPLANRLRIPTSTTGPAAPVPTQGS
jgi:NADH-quinone oxidoreductase subunit H